VVVEAINCAKPPPSQQDQSMCDQTKNGNVQAFVDICNGPKIINKLKHETLMEWKMGQQLPPPSNHIMTAHVVAYADITPKMLEDMAFALNSKFPSKSEGRPNNKDCILLLHCQVEGISTEEFDLSLQARYTSEVDGLHTPSLGFILIADTHHNPEAGQWVKYVEENIIPKKNNPILVDNHDLFQSKMGEKMDAMYGYACLPKNVEYVREMKLKFDPQNLFRSNPNILPKGVSADVRVSNNYSYA